MIDKNNRGLDRSRILSENAKALENLRQLDPLLYQKVLANIDATTNDPYIGTTTKLLLDKIKGMDIAKQAKILGQWEEIKNRSSTPYGLAKGKEAAFQAEADQFLSMVDNGKILGYVTDLTSKSRPRDFATNYEKRVPWDKKAEAEKSWEWKDTIEAMKWKIDKNDPKASDTALIHQMGTQAYLSPWKYLLLSRGVNIDQMVWDPINKGYLLDANPLTPFGIKTKEGYKMFIKPYTVDGKNGVYLNAPKQEGGMFTGQPIGLVDILPYLQMIEPKK
jgi:hypothetical protein